MTREPINIDAASWPFKAKMVASLSFSAIYRAPAGRFRRMNLGGEPPVWGALGLKKEGKCAIMRLFWEVWL